MSMVYPGTECRQRHRRWVPLPSSRPQRHDHLAWIALPYFLNPGQGAGEGCADIRLRLRAVSDLDRGDYAAMVSDDIRGFAGKWHMRATQAIQIPALLPHPFPQFFQLGEGEHLSVKRRTASATRYRFPAITCHGNLLV